MKRIIAAVLTLCFLVTSFNTTFTNVCMAEAEETVTEFMDCFLPTPIMTDDGKLVTDCWGAKEVGPRDPNNGLEDQNLQIRDSDDPEHDYVYWDGGIIKDDVTGKYYMFASRWDATETGHFNWINSHAVYAVSDNLYGPYEDQGLLWPDNRGGIGHNVFPFKLREDDPSGYKYGIIVCESREAEIFLSKSLDGPWVFGTCVGDQVNEDLATYGYEVMGGLDYEGNVKKRFNTANTMIVLRPDGKYEAFARDGDIAIADNILGPWKVVSECTLDPADKNLWDCIPGMRSDRMEDPVVWYSGGMFHCVVNQWDTRCAVYLTSENGIDDWKIYSGLAYMPDEPFLKYEDGSYNKWDKIERPNVYIEDDKVRAMTFSVVDVPKWNENANDNHGSKIIVSNFDGDALEKFSKNEDAVFKRNAEGLVAIADSSVHSWLDNDEAGLKDEWHKNFGSKGYLSAQKCGSGRLGEFSENANEGESRNGEDAKIAYVKFDISRYDLNELDKATLSLVYLGKASGWEGTDSVRVALADSDWEEGVGGSLGDVPEDDSVTWDNKPAVKYDVDDLFNTVMESEDFDTLATPAIINIDVTWLLDLCDKDEKVVTFAISGSRDNQCLTFASKEMGGNCEPRLIIDGGLIEQPTATPAPAVTPLPTVTPAPQATQIPVVNDDNKVTEFIVKGIKYKVVGKDVHATGLAKKKAKKVVIPAKVKYDNVTYKVTAISKGAFKKNKTIKRIVVGKNVKVIGNKAFYKCSSVKKYVVKNKKAKIGKKAFKFK